MASGKLFLFMASHESLYIFETHCVFNTFCVHYFRSFLQGILKSGRNGRWKVLCRAWSMATTQIGAPEVLKHGPRRPKVWAYMTSAKAYSKLKSAQRFRTVKRARERSECGTYYSCHWSQVDANRSVTTCCSICSICLWFRAWSTFTKPLVLNGVFPFGWTETKKAQTKPCKTFCNYEHVYLRIFNLGRHRTMLEHKIPGETLKIISNKRADRPQTCCRR